jgi:DNA-binding PadR family transcriptional regulator
MIRIVKRWKQENIIAKHSVENIRPGEDRFFYTLTSAGEKKLKTIGNELVKLFSLSGSPSASSSSSSAASELGSEEQGISVDVINGLVMEIPEYMTDLGVRFNEEQYRQFTEKIRQHLEEEGIHLEE